MTFAPFWGTHSAECLNSVLNVKALVGASNQEKALVEAFNVIVKSSRTFVWSSSQEQDQDQEDTEAGQQEEDRETRRREPHHRQINRMRLLRENVRLTVTPFHRVNQFILCLCKCLYMISDTLQLLFSCLRRSPCTAPRTTRHFPPSWPRRKPWWRSCCGSMASASGAWSVDSG